MGPMYTVGAYKEYDTKCGMDEEQVKCIDVYNEDQAEKLAKKIFDEGGYSSIYISYAHRDSSCYLNPRVGLEVVGMNWVDEFE